jgi:hypothetical protein
VDRLRDIRRLWRRVEVGGPDPSLTGVSGMVVVTEVVDRLNMIKLLDVAIGPIKARDRGSGRAASDRNGGRPAGRGGLFGRAGPLPRRCRRAGAHSSARVEFHHRGRVGPPVHRGAVAGGGDQDRRHRCGDACVAFPKAGCGVV